MEYAAVWRAPSTHFTYRQQSCTRDDVFNKHFLVQTQMHRHKCMQMHRNFSLFLDSKQATCWGGDTKPRRAFKGKLVGACRFSTRGVPSWAEYRRFLGDLAMPTLQGSSQQDGGLCLSPLTAWPSQDRQTQRPSALPSYPKHHDLRTILPSTFS